MQTHGCIDPGPLFGSSFLKEDGDAGSDPFGESLFALLIVQNLGRFSS